MAAGGVASAASGAAAWRSQGDGGPELSPPNAATYVGRTKRSWARGSGYVTPRGAGFLSLSWALKRAGKHP